MHCLRRTFLCCIPLLLASCAGISLSSPQALPRLIVQRLTWMDKVARVKQAKKLPVTDTKREAELLDAMSKQGAALGIPASATRAFFIGQMDAAKRYQEAWMCAHVTDKLGNTPLPDLAKTVRPALDDIGRQMLATLASARALQHHSIIVAEARDRLQRAGYSHDVIAAAVSGLEDGLR